MTQEPSWTAPGKAGKGWLSWLLSTERRHAKRRETPRLIAHYWDGGTPQAHRIRDISATGLYLKTAERWYPGTLVRLSLVRESAPDTEADRMITVSARVMRSDEGGVGLAFLLPAHNDSSQSSAIANSGSNRKAVERFLKRMCNGDGQALAEYILLLPILFVLVVNLVNFGAFFFAWITVANASRAAADYAVMGGASVGAARQASVAQIKALITADVKSLPNNPSVTVNICRNTNGTIATLSGTCTSIPSDSEPTSFILSSIDVTYTYVPVIAAGFQVSSMHVNFTLPPTTIHRRSVMRVLN